MHPSLRLANAATHGVRKPLINFLGKRQWPSTPEPQHPHPQAPADLQKSFGDFLNKFKASGSGSSSGSSPSTSKSGSGVYTDFWEAPRRYWKHDLSEAEAEAITVRGKPVVDV
ncbi:hypothetical protein BDY19DRAFT_898838 [Irpex rosettiformis]|uniref:Uncharacterized protein n=1 Tax=Irpex rosettiformis TaxID=378272 RepID=A0ACB8TQ90_9APHY|nr:hypothetical protein BDY19DRAFT_898838 [Irpex rosettiformis]